MTERDPASEGSPSLLGAVARRIPAPLLWASALLVVLLLHCIADPLHLWKELRYLALPLSARNLARVSAYAATFLAAVGAILAIAFSRGRLPTALLGVAFALATTLDLVFQLLGTRTGFDLNEYELARTEMGRLKDVVVYASLVLRALALSLAALGLLLLLRARVPERLRTRWAWLGWPLAVAAAVALSRNVHSIKPMAFPALVKVPAVATYYELRRDHATANAVRHLDPSLPVGAPMVKDVVWVVDESVRGDYLSANGYPLDTSPWLDSMAGSPDVVNFGVTSAAGQVSTIAHLAMRIGFQPRQVDAIDTLRYTLPTIFQYARHAGFRTTLIDLQMSNGERQNWLSMRDLADVDRYLTAERDLDVARRDRESLPLVRRILDGPERNLVVLVKWGAHWPYQDTYPAREAVFTPVIESSLDSMALEKKPLVLNTYRNAVRYAADGFLAALVREVPLEGRVIIYTSDHGQAMFDDGDIRTHGGDNPANGVGSVPLVILASGARRLFPEVRPHRYSAYQIFGTTLRLMGYGDDVVARYGPTLWEVPPPEYRTFLVSLNGVLKAYLYPDPRSSAVLDLPVPGR